jgi:hypothetical protein
MNLFFGSEEVFYSISFWPRPAINIFSGIEKQENSLKNYFEKRKFSSKKVLKVKKEVKTIFPC